MQKNKKIDPSLLRRLTRLLTGPKTCLAGHSLRVVHSCSVQTTRTELQSPTLDAICTGAIPSTITAQPPHVFPYLWGNIYRRAVELDTAARHRHYRLGQRMCGIFLPGIAKQRETGVHRRGERVPIKRQEWGIGLQRCFQSFDGIDIKVPAFAVYTNTSFRPLSASLTDTREKGGLSHAKRHQIFPLEHGKKRGRENRTRHSPAMHGNHEISIHFRRRTYAPRRSPCNLREPSQALASGQRRAAARKRTCLYPSGGLTCAGAWRVERSSRARCLLDRAGWYVPDIGVGASWC